MALADPQSVTISGTAIPLPRVSSVGQTSTYQSADGLTSMQITHSGNGAKKRHSISLKTKKITPDPFITTVNREVTETWTLSNNSPSVGFTAAELKAVADALLAFLSASSGANITKILGGES
jgi:hypothetical protein